MAARVGHGVRRRAGWRPCDMTSWVRVEKAYVFEGPEGKLTLSDRQPTDQRAGISTGLLIGQLCI